MRWRGLFIFRGGAAAAAVGGRKEEDEEEDEDKDEEEEGGGSRRMEAAAGGGGKIRRSAFRIARGWDEEYDGERRNLAVAIGIRCVISAVSIIIHTVVARGPLAPLPRRQAASRQPLDTHTVSLGPSTSADSLFLSLSLSVRRPVADAVVVDLGLR